MTSEQAIDLREYLTVQLNANGYSDIVMEVTTRLEEDYGEIEFETNSRSLLNYFLRESIDILDSLSNKNYNELINRFNALNIGDNRIEKISVELFNQGESVTFDLKDLPDYIQIKSTFQEILNEIENGN